MLASGGLDAAVEVDPSVLGEESVQRFGPQLPYLMKILAADRALSLQAHPTRAQAEAGFAAEEAAGVSRTDPARNYKDAWPKPEILCALGDFEALYGFADPAVVAEHFMRLGVVELTDLVAPLTTPGGAAGIEQVFLTLCGLPESERGVVERVAAAAQDVTEDGPYGTWCRTAVELAEQYPGDPGVIAALLMNRMSLVAGEAIYLPAGNLHAYLRGVGVELMANSDNVLRGGLTPKHVDVTELGRVLDFSPVGPAVVPTELEVPGVVRYVTPAPEFRLWRIELDSAGTVAVPASRYGRIVLGIGGEAALTAHDGRASEASVSRPASASRPASVSRPASASRPPGRLTLASGQAAWIPAGEEVTVSGQGLAFVAAPGLD